MVNYFNNTISNLDFIFVMSDKPKKKALKRPDYFGYNPDQKNFAKNTGRIDIVYSEKTQRYQDKSKLFSFKSWVHDNASMFEFVVI